MLLDCHIHMVDKNTDKDDFNQRLKKAGVDGGLVFSIAPQSFNKVAEPLSPQERLTKLFDLVDSNENLYPIFWIDPMEQDALDQVDLAIQKGIRGFKVICNHFYPGAPRPMEVFKYIARAGKPILFHSGILWDGNFSSKYNRPAEFEALLEIKDLVFALAHVSWPWCDECIAVYGKFWAAQGYTNKPGRMFIDITPGTPPIYRQDVLYKLLNVGYNINNNIIFGIDNITGPYDSNNALRIINHDNEIYNKLSIDNEIRNKIYSENVKRFLGIL